MSRLSLVLGCVTLLGYALSGTELAHSRDGAPELVGKPLYSRHVAAVFSRLGCNGGTCHGAVQGQNGFRLSLFGANPALDHEQVVLANDGRRINRFAPDQSLLLLKATGQVPHGGGPRMAPGSPEYVLMRQWIAEGSTLDPLEPSRIAKLRVTPAVQTIQPGESYRLRVDAKFQDGSVEDVTRLCSYDTLDRQVASVDMNGEVRATGVGDSALIVRYRAEPAMAMVVVPRPSGEAFPDVKPHNFIDQHILAKLRRLNIPPAELADEATFLRRVALDATGELPSPTEIRAFLADRDPQKRVKKIDALLKRPGYAALWTLKFCDLLKASDFGVYADAISREADAPRFAHWVRARIQENIPYDQFVERILTATSREGRNLDEWADEVRALTEGYVSPRTDLDRYGARKTLDLYWQRRASGGVAGTLQVAHTFLGLRLECAQCHRHPHDVWQQDDLLSFANFFMRVRQAGFQGGNDKKFPEVAAHAKKLGDEAKMLTEQAKQMKEKAKQLDGQAKQAKTEADKVLREIAPLEKHAEELAAQAKAKRDESVRLANSDKVKSEQLVKEAGALEETLKALREQIAEKRKPAEASLAVVAEHQKLQQEAAAMDRRSKMLPEVGKRMLHAEISHLPDAVNAFASVTSPLGSQASKRFRLLGQSEAIDVGANQDPRALVAAWMRRPDNPYFARAIVNRVWAHYFGRGIIDPPDNLSPFNPASHPELLQELSQQFIKNGYDLQWLHRTILQSRTYQQSSMASAANQMDRANYAFFYYRRLGAEVLVDALNQATGTTENMGMKFYHWPDRMKTVEVPFAPQNPFIGFMLEQFGRPPRNSAVQCDCERDANASVLQVLSFANHPRVWQKITDADGQAARIVKEVNDDGGRIEEVFLSALCRLPTDSERQACLKYLKESESAVKGLQGIMWSLLNTREFLLQH